MPRVIRPIGPVTDTLRKAGYRQYACIYVDGVQVPNVAILSVKVGTRIKFVGHYIDPATGKITKTDKLPDMKRAASRIMTLIPDTDPVMIDCPGCGTRHSDDDMCPDN